MSRVRSWAVLGASGFVGAAVRAELAGHGQDVRPVRAPRLDLPPGAVTGPDAVAAVLAAAAGPATTLRDRLEGCDVVVNAAGLARPTARLDAALLGADALLPAVVALASPSRARVVHLSSAAVQGRTRLDDTRRQAPLTPYGRAKALGERVLWALRDGDTAPAGPAGPAVTRDLVVLRATSVQGEGRAVSGALTRLAASPLASVLAPPSSPTPLTSVTALARLVRLVGAHEGGVPAVVLQPWEGRTTSSVLAELGGRPPRVLPRRPGLLVLRLAAAAGRLLGPAGVAQARRLELLWAGQEQLPGWLPDGWDGAGT